MLDFGEDVRQLLFVNALRFTEPRVDGAGQVSERRMSKDVGHRNLDVERGSDASHQADRQQRIASARKEVVLGANPRRVQQLGPDRRQSAPGRRRLDERDVEERLELFMEAYPLELAGRTF